MIPQQKRCISCDTPLSAQQATAGYVCANAICQWRIKSEPAKRRCKVCGQLLVAADGDSVTCRATPCVSTALFERTVAELAVQNERERVRMASLRARAIEFRLECNTELALADVASFAVTIVPRNTAPVTALADSRRDKLRDYLQRLLESASRYRVDGDLREIAAPHNVHSEYAPLGADNVLIAACTTCRGSCCSQGGEHAYLRVETIAQYLSQHAVEPAEDLVGIYMSHVGTHTVENGCVYQGSSGCTLPRELRSRTCNNYLCGELRSFLKSRDEGACGNAFIVSGEDETFDHGIFASAEIVHIVPRPGRAASRDYSE